MSSRDSSLWWRPLSQCAVFLSDPLRQLIGSNFGHMSEDKGARLALVMYFQIRSTRGIYLEIALFLFVSELSGLFFRFLFTSSKSRWSFRWEIYGLWCSVHILIFVRAYQLSWLAGITSFIRMYFLRVNITTVDDFERDPATVNPLRMTKISPSAFPSFLMRAIITGWCLRRGDAQCSIVCFLLESLGSWAYRAVSHSAISFTYCRYDKGRLGER
jgi:hypothetical protein